MAKKTKRRLAREAQARLKIALSLGIESAQGLTLTEEQIQRNARKSRKLRDISQLTDARTWVNHTDNGKCDRSVIGAKLGYRRATVFEGNRLTSDNKTRLDHIDRERLKVTLGAPVPESKITLQQFNVIKSLQASGDVIDYNQLIAIS